MVKRYAKMLSATTPETLDHIAEYEAAGRFNDHPEGRLTPDYLGVDGDYKYLPRNPFRLLYNAFMRLIIVDPFKRYSNKLFKTEVRGRENLKGVKGAIICCNHVNKLDCMAIAHAVKGKRVYTTAAEFNNMSGFLGNMMRIGGMLPLSDNFSAMKNLDNAVKTLLKKGHRITFFPEGSEWWGYEKPRPQFIGAYKYAAKNDVPVIPVFITFRPTPASRADRAGLKQFVVNILPPIYRDKTLPNKQAAQQMKNECAALWEQTYSEFYFAERSASNVGK